MQQARNTIELTEKYVLQTYSRFPVSFIKGEGAILYGEDGKEYIDFCSGIAVTNLGHCNPLLVEALKEIAQTLWHVSNLYYIPWQAKLAELIVKNSFSGKVFFCNSGAEANEGAIKFARLWGKKYKRGAYKIITATGSFHGRTLATLTATGQDKVKRGFEPLPEGFVHVPYNDIKVISKAIDKETAAIMLEPIQGEGGVIIPEVNYIREVKRICEEENILLILDEVQTGIARTGKLFAYMHFDITPDIMTLAKGLGNGVPIGAIVVSEKVVDAIEPGVHASTFGGNPIATRVALEVLRIVIENELWDRTNELGNLILEELKEIEDRVVEVRGKGLLIGIELRNKSSKEVAMDCLKKGLLVVPAGEKVVRLLPPLTIEKDLLIKGLSILKESI